MADTTVIKNPIKAFFEGAAVQNRFKEMLGNKAQGFITSVLQVVQGNKLLANADPQSVYGAAATAAVLDLPINNNFGFAHIVPYEEEREGKRVQIAQFQMGYKGFIQLGLRTGEFKKLGAAPIYKAQIVEANPLTGYVFDFTQPEDELAGYASYFQLLTGFESTWYMPLDKINKHALKYSKTYAKGKGRWKADFEAMALKTVLKLNLSKYAPLSIDSPIHKAIIYDQAKINNPDTQDVTYVDGTEDDIEQRKNELQNKKKVDLP